MSHDLVDFFVFCLILNYIYDEAVRFLFNTYISNSLLLLCFVEIETFKVILKAKSAVSRLERMCLAQPGYGSGLLPPHFCIAQTNVLLNSISSST